MKKIDVVLCALYAALLCGILVYAYRHNGATPGWDRIIQAQIRATVKPECLK